MNKKLSICSAAICAGAVTGILGAGGGIILAPLLSVLSGEKQSTFRVSLVLMLPICAVSLAIRLQQTKIPWDDTFIYLLGSSAGGLCAGIWGNRIPSRWLHRVFGVIVLLGGIRFLWS